MNTTTTRPARNPHFDLPWRRGTVGPAGSTDRFFGWVRILPTGWVEFVSDAASPHMEPTVTAYSPSSLVVVTYSGSWEDE